MIKKILFLLLVFCLGAGGGLWAEAFLLPQLATTSVFRSMQFIKNWNSRIQVIKPTETFIVDKDTGAQDMIARAVKVVVGIETVYGNTILKGSGLVFTTDGLIVTLATLVPEGGATKVFLEGDITPVSKMQVMKRDIKNNFALLKIDKNNLSAVSFASSESPLLGSRVFLVGKTISANGAINVVNEGIVRAQNTSSLETTIVEKPQLAGSSLFNSQGNVLGLATITQSGQVIAIPGATLHSFLGLQ